MTLVTCEVTAYHLLLGFLDGHLLTQWWCEPCDIARIRVDDVTGRKKTGPTFHPDVTVDPCS